MSKLAASVVAITTGKHLAQELRSWLADLGLAPDALRRRILATEPRLQRTGVIVTGDILHRCIYFLADDQVITFSPRLCSSRLPPIVETGASVRETVGEAVSVFDLDDALRHRLRLPRVVLVNLCVIESFPMARLSLGIATVCAHLRRTHIAQVQMIDMQTGATAGEVVDTMGQTRPDLVGFSVSFGQKQLAFDILSRLDAIITDSGPLVVMGNALPAMAPREFIDRFPSLIVVHAEGEHSAEDLARHLQGTLRLEQVSGVTYRTPDGSLVSTPVRQVDMANLSPPELDTLPRLVERKGALTLELSRGCQWGKCSFCPRTHKSPVWRGMTADASLEAIGLMIAAANRLGASARIYFADEEFVGDSNDATDRICSIATGIIHSDIEMRYDTEARVDQVFQPARDADWHIRRLHMWHLCKQAGLDRLFLGLESGSLPQLRRMNKGITPEQSVIALRMLSALGIRIRLGFVMFDQLMEGFYDLRDNIVFLDRTDALLKPVDMDDVGGLAGLFEQVQDPGFVEANSLQRPIYEFVSYMLATMEVLAGSPYATMMFERQQTVGRHLIDFKDVDTNMARHRVKFLDPDVGRVAVACQRWVDRNFALMYTVKSLHKTASSESRERLMHYMRRHRTVSQLLIKAMLSVLGEWPAAEPPVNPAYSVVTTGAGLVEQAASRLTDDRLHEVLTVFEGRFGAVVNELHDDFGHDPMLSPELVKWQESYGTWSLINDPGMDGPGITGNVLTVE